MKDGCERCNFGSLNLMLLETSLGVKSREYVVHILQRSRSEDSNSLRGIIARSSNSRCRARASISPSNPLTIHCLALPARCKQRLPILFDSGFARHQTCSSVRMFKQLSSFGRYSLFKSRRACCTKARETSFSGRVF